MRGSITFTVPVGPGDWLQVDGTVGPVHTAARFTLHTSPTPRETLAIRQRLYVLAGGRAELGLIQADAARLRDLVREEVNGQLWPQGRPEPADDDDREAMEALFEDALGRLDTPARWGLDDALECLAVMEFQAEWPSLIVAPPAGWETLDRASTATFFAIRRAHRKASEEPREKKG